MMRLLGWVGLSFLPGAIGAPFPAPQWYRSLKRPSWAPPSWIFGPVWTLLYLSMGVAAWLVASRPGRRAGGALNLFRAQLVLNAAWTPIFFGLRRVDLGLAEIVATWALVLATVVAFLRARLAAGLLLVPYLAWISFATLLNWAVWRRNR